MMWFDSFFCPGPFQHAVGEKCSDPLKMWLAQAEECGPDLWSNQASHGGYKGPGSSTLCSSVQIYATQLYNIINTSNSVAEVQPQVI